MATVNKKVFGTVRQSGYSSARLSQTDADSFSETLNANTGYWNLKHKDSYILCARGVAGVSIVDASTPSALSEVYQSFCHNSVGGNVGYRCMDVAYSGNTMVTVCRTGSYESTGIGYLETWDITTPGSTTSLDVYSKNASPDVAEALPHLYSAVQASGNYAYVSGQKSGFFIFDISTPATISLAGSLTSGSFETQGLDIDASYAYICNYGFGLRIVDIGTPASPGGVLDRSIACPTYNGIQLRPWYCKKDGNYLYVCTNTSGATNDTERSLLILDVSDPANIPTDGSTWIRCKIPAEDQDTAWVSPTGDKPYLGIDKIGNTVFIGGGESGALAFDVTYPTSPRYLGKLGNISDGDLIGGVVCLSIGGVPHVVYGDYIKPTGVTTSQQLYIGQIHIK